MDALAALREVTRDRTIAERRHEFNRNTSGRLDEEPGCHEHVRVLTPVDHGSTEQRADVLERRLEGVDRDADVVEGSERPGRRHAFSFRRTIRTVAAKQ